MTNDYGTNSDDIQWPKSKPWMPPSYLLMPKEIMNNQSFDLTYVLATGGGRGQIRLICSSAGQGGIALENWEIRCSSRPAVPLGTKTTSKMGIRLLIDIILVFSTALCTVQCYVFRQEKRPKIGHFHAKVPAPAYARST